MDDSFGVCHVDGTGECLDEGGRLGGRPGLAIKPVRQTAAPDPLQGEERPALVAANLVDPNDVGVLYPRRQLCLQPEPQLLRRGQKLARQHHFQGDEPVEPPVPRLVHHPHPSAPDLLQDVVVGDLPRSWESQRVWRGGYRLKSRRSRLLCLA